MHYRDSIHHIKAFYDADCGMCSKARNRLSAEPTHLDVEFIALQSDTAKELLGAHYDADQLRKEIHVLAENGDLWVGGDAWILLLWSTCRWRSLATTLASPLCKPMVKKVVGLISENRFRISDLMKLKPDTNPTCTTGHCAI